MSGPSNIKIQKAGAEEIGNAQVRSPAADLERWADLEQWQQTRQFGLSLSSLSHKPRSDQAGTDQAQTSHRIWILFTKRQ
jgi:head-tail adaptor